MYVDTPYTRFKSLMPKTSLPWADTENAQHRYSTRFAAMLQNKMHVFVARFTEA